MKSKFVKGLQALRKEQRDRKKIEKIEEKYTGKILQSMKQCPMKPLTKSQEAEIKEYFYQYFHRDVPTYWHQYLYSRNGIYSKKYIPASLYFSSIMPRLNNYKFGPPYADKGFYDTVFRDFNRPRTIVKNVNGFFYDGDGPISKEEALSRCRNLESAVIKPSLFGHWGEGVQLFHSEDGAVPESNCSLEEMFSQYKNGFIVQEKLIQHPDLGKLNPTSVNTIRVMSYREGDEIIILYAVIRIGREGKVVDNETAGGIKADVDISSGRIKGPAFGGPKEKDLLYTDSGVLLDGYQIPSFPQILEFVKEMHFRLPYFRLVGWDISVDEAGRPVMIEWNKSPELSQVAHGPAFGEYTDRILSGVIGLPNSRL